MLGELKDEVTYRVEPVSTNEEGIRKWDLVVDLKPSLEWGWYTGSLRIDGTVNKGPGGRPVPSILVVGMNANVQGSLRASDTMFRLLVLPQNHTFSKTIRVRSKDESPFEIRAARVEDSNGIDMQVLVEPIPESKGSSYDITLMGNTGSHTGGISGKVVLETTIPGEDAVVLKIAGSIRK